LETPSTLLPPSEIDRRDYVRNSIAGRSASAADPSPIIAHDLTIPLTSDSEKRNLCNIVITLCNPTVLATRWLEAPSSRPSSRLALHSSRSASGSSGTIYQMTHSDRATASAIYGNSWTSDHAVVGTLGEVQNTTHQGVAERDSTGSSKLCSRRRRSCTCEAPFLARCSCSPLIDVPCLRSVNRLSDHAYRHNLESVGRLKACLTGKLRCPPRPLIISGYWYFTEAANPARSSTTGEVIWMKSVQDQLHANGYITLGVNAYQEMVALSKWLPDLM
jgi:hypothetical protein